jgi:inner membrane protein
MDNLTHSFCGWILSRAGLDRYGSWVPATLIVTANLPDFESLLPPYGDRAHYLVNHRGISHSVIGLLGETLIVALLLVAVGRLFKNRIKDPPRLGPALLVAAVGVSSHLLLDWFNTYGIRPWLPFDSTWYYGDLAFIIDPWMWLIPGIAIFLGSPLRRIDMIFWTTILALTSAVVLWGASRGLIPWGVIIGWMLAISGAVFLRLYRPVASPAILGKLGVAAWAFYIFILFTCSRASTIQALSFYSRQPRSEKILKTSGNPVPGIPWRYEILLQTETEVRQYSVNLLGGTVALKQIWETDRCREYLPQVADTREYNAWRVFARHPVCSHQSGFLNLGDARYKTTDRGDWSELRVPLPTSQASPK